MMNDCMRQKYRSMLETGLHKTGIRGIQDTRQIVDGKTNDKENNAKKVSSDFNKPSTSSLRHQCNGPISIKFDYKLIK